MANVTISISNHSKVTTEDTLTNSLLESAQNNDQLIAIIIQATMAFVGFGGNSLTFITLKKNGHIFAPSVLKLIKNQAVVDAIVCLLGSIYVLQPTMWKTHWNENLDIFICHVSRL